MSEYLGVLSVPCGWSRPKGAYHTAHRCDAQAGQPCMLPDMLPFDALRAVIGRDVDGRVTSHVMVHELRYREWRRTHA